MFSCLPHSSSRALLRRRARAVEGPRRCIADGAGFTIIEVLVVILIVGGLHELTINAIQHGRDVHELQPLAAKAISAILNATVLDARSSVQ